MTRRSLLFSSPVAVAAGTQAAQLPIRKAVEFNMLPKTLPTADAFAMARRAGFEVIECPTTPDPAAAEEMLAASRKTGLPIHFGDEPGALAQPAVVGRSRSGRKKHGRTISA
jgi:hexulose-6-phosphate isomerase